MSDPYTIKTLRDLIRQAETLAPEVVYAEIQALTQKQIRLNTIKSMLKELKSVLHSTVLDEAV